MSAKRIVVVGAGPAGMMAAIRAAQMGAGVTLIEKKPSPGNKILLSGKGRCNLTNACDLESFLARFSSSGQFLRDAFKAFFNTELMRFFEERGAALHTERQMRVFPASNRSATIVNALLKELERLKVSCLYRTPIEDIVVARGAAEGVTASGGKYIPADKVILATGGLSYAFTGSTGEGISLARKLGHRVEPLLPGLVPLVTKEIFPKQIEGMALKNVRLTFSDGKKKMRTEVGELLFTAFGISGPLALSVSGKVAQWLADKKQVHVDIDLKPGLTYEQLDARLIRECKENALKNVKNTLKSLLPQSLIAIFIDEAKISPFKQANQVTQEERRRMLNLLKQFRLTISATRPLEEAMVTQGGVSLKDINPRTMESRVVKGLYFAGEMMDIAADTGGFNLQAAFSTGYLAGESAAA